MSDDGRDDDKAFKRLRHLSELLGRPIGSFYVDPQESAQLRELLRLWDALTDGKAREAALEAIRAIAERR